MSDSRKRTTINLSLIGDRIERLRTDSAWKELKLSNKALVLLKEYLEILEKLSHEDLEETIHNLRSDAEWKSLTFSEKLLHIIEEHLTLFRKEEPEAQRKSQPSTIGQLVQQYYWRLSESNIKNIEAIAQGEKPTRQDLIRISSALGMEFSDVQALADKSFPKDSKEKEANGYSQSH